jgi:hypothetical protein
MCMLTRIVSRKGRRGEGESGRVGEWEKVGEREKGRKGEREREREKSLVNRVKEMSHSA